MPSPLPLPGSTPPPRPAGTPTPKPVFNQSLGSRPKPKMQTVVQGDVAVVTILESHILDETNIAEIGRELMNLVTKQYMIKMVIDLSEVRYMSSAVLRQIIALYKAIKAEKGDLKLCRIAPEIREVFKITQLDKMIEIKDDLDSAVKSFKKPGGWGFLQR
jgi:anti-sigma B factor antagonist